MRRPGRRGLFRRGFAGCRGPLQGRRGLFRLGFAGRRGPLQGRSVNSLFLS